MTVTESDAPPPLDGFTEVAALVAALRDLLDRVDLSTLTTVLLTHGQVGADATTAHTVTLYAGDHQLTIPAASGPTYVSETLRRLASAAIYAAALVEDPDARIRRVDGRGDDMAWTRQQWPEVAARSEAETARQQGIM